ncbi:MAG: hypothetical protein ACOH2J_01535 [Allorhizobium sp.]
MIREDIRSRRLAVVPDFVVNPGSALYGSHRPPAPTAFMDAVMAQGWGIIKMPPHVASPSMCENLIEISVGDIIDYRKNGYEVVIVGIEDLPQGGVWLDSLKASFARLGKDLPPVVTISISATADETDLLDRALSPAVES